MASSGSSMEVAGVSAAGAQARAFGTIGREMGPVGRWFRLFAGMLAIAVAAGEVARGSHDTAALAQIVLYLAVAGAFYTALHRVLGERVLARVHPWVATLIVLAPLGVRHVPSAPQSLQQGVSLFGGISLVVAFAIGYGGCEVVAIPSLLFRRRYVVYCPWNVVDAVERPLRSGPPRALRLGAAVLGLAVGAYFLLLRDLLDQLDIRVPAADRWAALLLVVPTAVLVRDAWTAVANGGRRLTTEAASAVIGSLVLLALLAAFSRLAPGDTLWAVVMLVAVAVAVLRWAATAARRKAREPRA